MKRGAMKQLKSWWAKKRKAFYARQHARKAALQRKAKSRRGTRFPGASLLLKLRERRQAQQRARTKAQVKASGIGVQRRRILGDLWKGVPAIAVSACIGVLCALGFVQQRSAGSSYWQRGEQALADQDYRASEVYMQKALKRAGTDRRRMALTLA